MNNISYEEKMLRQLAEQSQKRKEEIRENPLSQYSTTELKKELRRRKGK
jgi:hypothetical protein